jgi:predicted DsbA family dithiol-disulfide isomerase
MVEPMSTATTTVFLYVDPACPWAWLTSRWLAEVEKVRPIRVATRLFDLAEINRDRDSADKRKQRSHSAGEKALRVLALVGREAGDDAMARAYAEVGEAYHERAESLGEAATLQAAVRRAGLDPAMVESAWADESTMTEVLDQHEQALGLGAFGVPAICFEDGPATFGPVVDRRVTGDAAGELWDHVSWLMRQGFFYEMKRERRSKADIGRYRAQSAA